MAGTPFLIALVVALAGRGRNQTGINALGAAGAVVALSLVIAATVVARRA